MEILTAENQTPPIIASRPKGPMHELFRKLSQRISWLVGSPVAFMVALLLIVCWAITGPIFNFSDTWQLVINTGTTIVTFLMVFLIQNTQNRDARAVHLKLDELLKAARGARNSLVNVEEIPDDQLEVLHEEFRLIHEEYSRALDTRQKNKLKN